VCDEQYTVAKLDDYHRSEGRIEKDVDQSVSVYSSWRWLVGFLALTVSTIIHVFMLQFLDLTLLAANSVTGIVAATVLATQVLGEVFIFRYDCSAFVFISAGCFTIVLNANTTQTEYTADQVFALLKAPRTLCFVAACLAFIGVSLCMLKIVLHRLRRFEKDVESYEKEHGLKEGAKIFPPREACDTGAGERSPLDSELAPNFEADEMQRPARVLIETLNDMPVELLDEVSARSRRLKTLIKGPMLLIVVSSALQSGLTIVSLKLVTELGQSEEMRGHVFLVIFLMGVIALSGAAQLHMLNLAMKYYD